MAWWLWPHLLSLDAPLVAIVWQRWWARAAGIRVPWAHEFILGAGVWLIYVADRLADTAPHVTGEHETARHAFYQRERRTMRWMAAAAFLGLAALSPSLLPFRQFVAGLGLLALAGGYFWLIHRRKRRDWSRVVPKEAAVGGMFAVGTTFFVFGHTGLPVAGWVGAVWLFGGLCFLNCALITKWERNAPDLSEPSSLLNAFPRLTARLNAGCLSLALLAFAAAMTFPQGSTFLPMVGSALLLAVLDRQSSRLSADALRVLADAALLTPWLGIILPLRSL